MTTLSLDYMTGTDWSHAYPRLDEVRLHKRSHRTAFVLVVFEPTERSGHLGGSWVSEYRGLGRSHGFISDALKWKGGGVTVRISEPVGTLRSRLVRPFSL